MNPQKDLGDPGQVWASILDHLKARVSSQKFETWFRKLTPFSMTRDEIVLEVPNAFFVDFFEDHNLPTLRESIESVLGFCPSLRFQVRQGAVLEPSAKMTPPVETVPTMPAPPSPRPSSSFAESGLGKGRRIAPDRRTARTSEFKNRFTFENFVVGRGNEFAYASCMAVAKEPARSYNPLFLHGGVGLGKTHLMHAIGTEIMRRDPDAKVRYVSSERFMNEMIESIQRGATLEFRNRYRKLDMLLIDDIQFLAGKESTQDEFFHTFNTLYDSDKQVVIASDRAPKEIRDLEERLISRFHWGLISDIQAPDLETRIAILQSKAEEKGIDVPKSVLFEIASCIQSNIRELEGCLLRIKAFADLLSVPITNDLVKEALGELVGNQQKRPIEVHDIQKYVAHAYGVPPESLRGKRRTSTVVSARQVAMFMTKELTPLTVVEIGRRFGNRDHSTVLHAVKKIRQLCVDDAEVKARVDQIRQELISLGQM